METKKCPQCGKSIEVMEPSKSFKVHTGKNGMRCAASMGQANDEYPFVWRRNGERKGERCRIVSMMGAWTNATVQVEFKDGFVSTYVSRTSVKRA